MTQFPGDISVQDHTNIVRTIIEKQIRPQIATNSILEYGMAAVKLLSERNDIPDSVREAAGRIVRSIDVAYLRETFVQRQDLFFEIMTALIQTGSIPAMQQELRSGTLAQTLMSRGISREALDQGIALLEDGRDSIYSADFYPPKGLDLLLGFQVGQVVPQTVPLPPETWGTRSIISWFQRHWKGVVTGGADVAAGLCFGWGGAALASSVTGSILD